MKFKRFLAMTAALCMTTAMFASCGDTASDDSSKKETKKDTTTTTTTTAAEDTPDAADSTAAGEDASAAAGTDSAAAPAGDGEAYIDSVTGLECFVPSADYTPVTEFQGYDAFLMFADMNWMWNNFSGQGYPEEDRGSGAFGVDADVTGDGEYTVSLTTDSIGAVDAVNGAINPQVVFDGDYVLPATGVVVFCVDITGICDGTTDKDGEPNKKNELKEGDDAGVNKHTVGKYTGQDIKCEVTSIKADGQEVEFDPTKIKYGNIENNNNCYRIEIYNEYGDTKKDPGIDTSALMFAKSLEVTFKIEGLSQEG